MDSNPAQHLLDRVGEQLNIGIGDASIRSNVLNLLGEKQTERVVKRTEYDESVTEMPELDPLEPDEQFMAQMQIQEMHPLSNTPLSVAFPWLCICLRCCPQGEASEKDQEKTRQQIDVISKRLSKMIKKAGGEKYEGTSFRKDMSKKFGVQFMKKDGTLSKQKSKPMSEADRKSPFAEYGFGIQAWINSLFFLFLLYCLLSVIAFLIMKQYETFNGLEENLTTFGQFTKFSLGNVGFAKTMCFFQLQAIKNNEQRLKCPKGTLSPIVYHGVVGYSEDKTLKLSDGVRPVGHDFCGDPKLLQPVSNCKMAQNSQELKKYYKENCEGKKECSIDLLQFRNTAPDKNSNQQCFHDFTSHYIQVKCDISDADVKFSKQTSVMVIFLGIVISLIFSLSIGYLSDIQDFLYKHWDISNVTPADYTIKMHISDDQYEAYKSKHLADDGDSATFDKVITQEIESKLRSCSSVLTSSTEQEIKVATITFGYKNGDLIRALRQRGALIASAQFNKVKEQDLLLNQIIRDDIDKLKQPVCAFITFTEQEAFERCEKYLFKYDRNGASNDDYDPLVLFESEMKIEEAPEPSNVIWENLEVSSMTRGARKSGVVMLITLFIFITFLVYSGLKSRAGSNKLKYPSSTNCNSIGFLFSTTDADGKTSITDDSWKEFERIALYDKDQTTENSRGAGYYMCYCKLNKKQSLVNIMKKDKPEDELCYKYQNDQTVGLALTNFVTILVTIINIVIRTINIKLINIIGYPTVSKQVSLIMTSIFWATFINTGVILLMTNANMSYAPPPLNIIPIHQQYPDFNSNWYEEIGPQLTKTMFITAVYPYMEMVIFGGLWLLYQILDKSCNCCDKNATKAKTTQQYINLYAGPAYLMHFKYSSILTQIYISFTYGLFIPVLFPIAAFGIFNMYMVEKFALLYYYRKPPMYDDKLQKDAIKLMRNAPVGMFLLGYWALGNSQIFFNETSEKVFRNEVSDPKHQLMNFHGGNQTHFVLLVIFLLFMKKIVLDNIIKCYKFICMKCCDKKFERDVLADDVDEGLPPFWQCLTGDDQKIWYASEIYSKYMFGIKSVDDDTIQLLRSTDRAKISKEKGGKKQKCIEGDSRYDILTNINYQQEFQFIQIEQRNEFEDFMLSNMILRALNLDDDTIINSDAVVKDIFKDSFKLLMDQNNSQSAINKEMGKTLREQNEGGCSDDYTRYTD